MSWWDRLASVARELLGIEERHEEAAREIASPPVSSFDFDAVIPDIGSLPPDPVSESPQIEDVADFIELLDLRDEYAQNLLEIGWFNTDISPDMRHDAREAFFEYTGWEEDDFPWEEWREWYEDS